MDQYGGMEISMNKMFFAIVCSPFCIAGLALNLFFIFCLHRPLAGANVRQPLHFLLGAELCNSTAQQLIITVSVVLSFFTPPAWLLVINVGITLQTFCSNFSASAWISIFYYIKLVPQRHKALAWIKKNNKTAVFVGFFFDQFLLLSALSMGVVSYFNLGTSSGNLTSNEILSNLGTEAVIMNVDLYKLATKLILMFFFFPFCALSFSWGRTYVYLRGHIRQMEQTTGTKSSTQHRNQMRVTVMGIVQTALFIPSCLWAISMALLFGSPLYERIDYDKHITMTISSIATLANIVCLGFSQSVFRLRVIAVLKRVKKTFGYSDQVE